MNHPIKAPALGEWSEIDGIRLAAALAVLKSEGSLSRKEMIWIAELAMRLLCSKSETSS